MKETRKSSSGTRIRVYVYGVSGSGKNYFVDKTFGSDSFDLDLAGYKLDNHWYVDLNKINLSVKCYMGTAYNLREVLRYLNPSYIMFIWPPYEMWLQNQRLKREAKPDSPASWWAHKERGDFEAYMRQELSKLKANTSLPVNVVYTAVGQHSGKAWHQDSY